MGIREQAHCPLGLRGERRAGGVSHSSHLKGMATGSVGMDSWQVTSLQGDVGQRAFGRRDQCVKEQGRECLVEKLRQVWACWSTGVCVQVDGDSPVPPCRVPSAEGMCLWEVTVPGSICFFSLSVSPDLGFLFL